MKKIKGWITSKTVWGAVAIGASFIPKLAPYEPLLRFLGVSIGGAGIADKLDRIKAAVQDTAKVQPRY